MPKSRDGDQTESPPKGQLLKKSWKSSVWCCPPKNIQVGGFVGKYPNKAPTPYILFNTTLKNKGYKGTSLSVEKVKSLGNHANFWQQKISAQRGPTLSVNQSRCSPSFFNLFIPRGVATWQQTN